MYGIFAYIYHKFRPNVANIPYMEHLGVAPNTLWGNCLGNQNPLQNYLEHKGKKNQHFVPRSCFYTTKKAWSLRPLKEAERRI